jgi:hypothetical protein
MKEISPKYQMNIISQVEKKIWEEYSSYKKVLFYIKKWHIIDWGYNNNDYNENFSIESKEQSQDIDLEKTLHNVPGELLIKIAIDLGVETPDFIPAYPTFKNQLKSDYNNVFQSFEKAVKNIEEDPDLAVGLANSTLESIIKHILEDETLKTTAKSNETLYKLTGTILKEFSMFPNGKNSEMPEEINNIGSSLINVSQNIEGLRSKKTNLHGKAKDDYVLNDSLYAYFIVNSITTVGMFLKSFYETKYKVLRIVTREEEPDDLPF